MKKIDLTETTRTKDYVQTLAEIKTHIKEAQIKAALSANKELLKLYWYMGKTISENQKQSNWKTGDLERLAKDLQNSFPGAAGFSRANIFHIRAFYLAYEKVQQAVRLFEDLPIFQIPWGHNVAIITKIKNVEERLWYAQKTIDDGLSRSALETAIESALYRREGKAITDFKKTLPEPHSGAAQQTLKDPYVFDFLTLTREYNEQDVEHGLIENVQKMRATSTREMQDNSIFIYQQSISCCATRMIILPSGCCSARPKITLSLNMRCVILINQWALRDMRPK